MKKINIISWNVNGLKSIEKKRALEWVDKQNVDFLFLQETKLSYSQFEISNLFEQSYSYISNNYSKFKNGFSGTFSMTNNPPLFESSCEHIDLDNDGRIIKYVYNNLIMFNVYFPNGKLNASRLKYKLKFYSIFLKYCKKLKKQNYSIIICGDFNTAHTKLDLKPGKIYSNSGFSELEQESFHKFIDEGFIDTYRFIHGNKPNAYSLFPYRSRAREKNEGWRIDYILISEDLKDNLSNAYIMDDILGSDHCPIGIEIYLKDLM